MPTIKKQAGTTGLSYKITVSNGLGPDGRQQRYYKNWRAPASMSESRAEREATRIAYEFEQEIRKGYEIDSRRTFSEYADYVLELKESTGAKHNTIREYRYLKRRIDASMIGKMKLADIRPQHLNRFYQSLRTAPRLDADRARGKPAFAKELETRGIRRDALAKAANTSPTIVTNACREQVISLDKAKSLSEALDRRFDELFELIHDDTPLSDKSILEYHRFIHTVLDQAEREMLVPYNAASRATPPSVTRKTPNYFQPEQVSDILSALEDEPIKWRTITHLLLVTGCRRGEIAGLKWSKVDLGHGRLEISANLCYSKENGIYETTTKTGKARYINIPHETIELLEEYRAWQDKQRLACGDRWQETGYLFTQEYGDPINPTSITAWLRKFSQRRGLPHINPHAFRHTVASVLIANGTDIVTVSKQLGHSQVSTTGDIYSHVIDESKAQAAECIADVMLRRKP